MYTHLSTWHLLLDSIVISHLTWSHRNSHFPLSNMLLSQQIFPTTTHCTCQTFSSVLWFHFSSCSPHLIYHQVLFNSTHTSQFPLLLSISTAITLVHLIPFMRTTAIACQLLSTSAPVHLPQRNPWSSKNIHQTMSLACLKPCSDFLWHLK